MANIRRHYLFLDLGFYSACNLKCTYCRDKLVKDKNDFHFEHLVQQVTAFFKHFQAGVVKISGYGEITMWNDFPKVLDYLHSRFSQVQVITNGTFEPHIAELILKYRNVSPNITIDGHTLEMNTFRVHGNSDCHERILNNLKLFISAGRAVEVNCVLHRENAKGLSSFCSYLAELGENLIMLFPFPVKSFDRAREAADQMKSGFGQLVNELDAIWEQYQSILPPKPYVEDLKKFLDREIRTDPCHIHWANLGSGSRNERLYCANYGEELTYGSMMEALTSEIDRIHKEENEHLQTGHIGPRCSKCFNHFHVINLYLHDIIALTELQSLPSLRDPCIALIAEKMKMEFQQTYQMAKNKLS